MQIKIIGIGGVGTHLVVPLCRYLDNLSNLKEKPRITLIDGDQFEPKNESRQDFYTFGNKAEVTAKRMKKLFPNLEIESKPWYVTNENIFLLIRNKDIVFLCVDNHATRKIVSDFCEQLEEIKLISGGNEYTDGNVQVYIRHQGKNITPPLTYLHPEISNPRDLNPAEMSCEELSVSGAPQLIFTNLLVAAWMLAAFWNITTNKINYSELYFDLETGNSRSRFFKKI